MALTSSTNWSGLSADISRACAILPGVVMMSFVSRHPATFFNANIGIDVGLSRFLTASDGMIVENPRFLKKSSDRLAYEQYKFSKMKKGSAGRAKQKKRIARLHEHVSNQRRDFLHKVTARTAFGLTGRNENGRHTTRAG